MTYPFDNDVRVMTLIAELARAYLASGSPDDPTTADLRKLVAWADSAETLTEIELVRLVGASLRRIAKDAQGIVERTESAVDLMPPDRTVEQSRKVQ